MSNVGPAVQKAFSDAMSELKIGDANEAQTRFKLVDLAIFEMLGWSRDDIKVEDRVDEDGNISFTDYTLTTGRHSIIIEAKRVGFDFSGMPKSRRAFLRGTWLNKPVGSPINQARNYARTQGVGFCAATNGASWVIFPVNRRDQVSFEESTAILFHDISTMLADDPNEFVELLSRQAIIDGALDRALLGSERDQHEPRRLNNVYDRSFSKIDRTSIFKHIEREIIAAFSEELLTENPELLEECYVSTPERTRFDTRIQMHLAPREQVMKTRPIRPMGRGTGDVSRIFRESALSTRPVALLTLGLVGSGKTTFLAHTSNITAKEIFVQKDAPSPHWVYIDFRNFSKSKSPRVHLAEWMFEYVKKHPFLRDYGKSVSKAYAEDIEALTSGFMSLLQDEAKIKDNIADMIKTDYLAKDPFAIKVLRQSAKKNPVFIVVDNVDQIEEVEIQSNIFLEATAVAREVHASLILAMRDATYVKNRSSAVFDAFDFDAVYIDPPDILAVLSKRFVVAENLMRGKVIEFETEGGAHVTLRDGKIVIELLRQSVLGTEVGRIINVAATGDTRTALRMTRQFLQYGYSSTTRAVEFYQRSGRYKLPEHEALRAIMLGNQNVYRENFSVIGNPFDSYLGRSDLQFLRLFVMYALVLYASEREFEGLPAREIIELIERIGVSSASSEQVIKDLIRQRYLFSRSHQDYSRESVIIPSRLCGYVSRELVGRFVFIETVMYDTFIGEDAVWDNIKANMAAVYRERNPINKLGMRREVASIFFDFVERRMELLAAEARARGLPPQWCANPMTKVKPLFDEDMRRAVSSANRNYGPNSHSDNLPIYITSDRSTNLS